MSGVWFSQHFSQQYYLRSDTEPAPEPSKLVEYDQDYLKELAAEKESLAKNETENRHALRLLEAGQFLKSLQGYKVYKFTSLMNISKV